MNTFLVFPVLLMLLFATPTFAGFKEGLDAHGKGNYATALKEFVPLAEQGHTVAQFGLGVMYEEGQGVPQDYKSAVKWYTKAAEQGHASAQFNLALKYEKGEGVIQDYTRTHMWWNIAAAQGEKTALKYRDTVAKLMTSSQIAEAQKLARECMTKEYRGC